MSKRRLEDLDHDGHADPKMPRMEPLHMLPPVPHGYYQNLAPFSNQMPYFPPPMMQPLQFNFDANLMLPDQNLPPPQIYANPEQQEETDSEPETSDEDEADDQENQPPKMTVAQQQTNTKVFKVAGRLNLMGNGGKYDVCTAEMKRRIYDEGLNSSVFAALMRKAKKTNNGKGLREELKSFGIELPTGKRKTAIITLLTSLVEAEAEQLATDVDKLTVSGYPRQNVASHLYQNWAALGPAGFQRKQQDLAGFLSIMNEMCHLLNVVQTPVQERDPEAFQDPTLQQGFNTYSLITHGFGIINQRTWAEMFRSIGQELQNQVYAAHMTMPPFPAPGGYPQMGL